MKKKINLKDIVIPPEEEEGHVYCEAANGILVRVPISQYETWSKAQDEIAAGTYVPTEADKKRREELAQLLGLKK